MLIFREMSEAILYYLNRIYNKCIPSESKVESSIEIGLDGLDSDYNSTTAHTMITHATFTSLLHKQTSLTTHELRWSYVFQ
jgi:hypothetical protein